MKKVFIFIGPPGSGKGTQAELLAKEFGFGSISPGAIFRGHMARKTAISKSIRRFMDKGTLVPDDITAKIILAKLAQAKKTVVLDGFPRNMNQAMMLRRFFDARPGKCQPVVLEFALPAKEIYKRIAGRYSCACGEIFHLKFRPPRKKGKCDSCSGQLRRRADSLPAVVKARIRSYQRETAPVVKFYKNETKRFYRLDARKKIQQVYVEVKRIVRKFS